MNERKDSRQIAIGLHNIFLDVAGRIGNWRRWKMSPWNRLISSYYPERGGIAEIREHQTLSETRWTLNQFKANGHLLV